MPSHRGRQKQLEKQRKRREVGRKEARALANARPSSVAGWLKHALAAPFGPAFLGAGWSDTGSEMPAIVTALITRQLDRGLLLPYTMLIDRTCLGVKDATVLAPVSRAGLDEVLDRMAASHDGVEEVDVLVVQSIVFHAVDYARALGFTPAREFVPAFLEPRPEVLLETPWHWPDRPLYVVGPHDDPMAIAGRLIVAKGFDFDMFVGDGENVKRIDFGALEDVPGLVPPSRLLGEVEVE